MYCSVDNRQNQREFAGCDHPSYDWRPVDAEGRPVKKGCVGPVFRRWVQVSCTRPRCPCPLCRRTYARNISAILTESFKTLPPTHFIVLKTAHRSPPRDLWAAWWRYRRSFTADVPDWGYYLQMEEGRRAKNPHIHLLVRTAQEVTKQLVRQHWERAADCSVSVYCEPAKVVYGADGKPSYVPSARYVPKHWVGLEPVGWDEERNEPERYRLRQVTPWLPGPEWKGYKTSYMSAGFLSAPKEELWQQVKAEWFPDGWFPADWGVDDDMDKGKFTYPIWNGPVTVTADNVAVLRRRQEISEAITKAKADAEVNGPEWLATLKKEEYHNPPLPRIAPADSIALEALLRTGRKDSLDFLRSYEELSRPLLGEVLWLPDGTGQPLPGMVSRVSPGGTTYWLRLKLRPDEYESLPGAVRRRLYVPSGMPAEAGWRVEAERWELRPAGEAHA